MLSALKKMHHSLGGLDASIIHIAGTKGKGTTAVLLAKILQLHKKKVGFFTSPAIISNEETIQINGEPIRPERLKALLKKVHGLGEKISDFEALTLAALLYFQEERCSYAVIECGWGGKNDATNIVENKVLTILTHIELEHTEVLGNTIAEITQHKLGICRPGVPLLTLPTQPDEVFVEIRNAGLRPVVAPSYEVGHHHPESAGLAVMAADMLGLSMDSVIHEELEKLVIPGRFEIIAYGPHTLILEGAHTYDSISYFLEKLHEYELKNPLPSPQFGIHILKDKAKDLWKLFPRSKSVWVPLGDERAGTKPSSLREEEVSDILKRLAQERKSMLFVFCGSFKLVALVKRSL